MSNTQSPPTRANPTRANPPSGCMAWFVLGLAFLCIAIVLIVIGAGILFDEWDIIGGGGKSAAVNKVLPDLNLVPITAAEKPVAMADLSGRVVLINFWATGCPPCRAELPEIAEISREFKDNADVLILPVSVGDDLEQLSTDSIRLLREMDMDMPCYADSNGTTQQAFANVAGTNQLSLPTTLILDRKGVVRGVWIGFRPGQGKKMQAMITKLLGEN